jgi:CheY-like chemotaxis protein
MSLLPCALLIDDDDTTNYLNRRLIQRMGITDTVLVAPNGEEAMRLLYTNQEQHLPNDCPALILLDLKMPVMDGFTFLEAFAHRTHGRIGTVIIMLTTSLHVDDVQRMQTLPIAGYLTKPLTEDKIKGVLETHFGYQEPGN